MTKQEAITRRQERSGYITTEAAADLLGVSHSYVWDLHKKGFLGAARKRGRRYYYNADMVNWYAQARGTVARVNRGNPKRCRHCDLIIDSGRLCQFCKAEGR